MEWSRCPKVVYSDNYVYVTPKPSALAILGNGRERKSKERTSVVGRLRATMGSLSPATIDLAWTSASS